MRYNAAWHRRLRRILADLPFRSQSERIGIRRALASDPVAFSIIYLSHHLKDSEGNVTFSEVHYEWARIAETWRVPGEPQSNRHAFIEPRETGNLRPRSGMHDEKITRNRRIPGARYFGPYPKIWAVRDTIDLMVRAFPIRTCSDSSYKRAMATGRPCFPGQIGRCQLRPVRRRMHAYAATVESRGK